jgi:hypothetical protein
MALEQSLYRLLAHGHLRSLSLCDQMRVQNIREAIHSGKLLVNEQASPEDQERAQATIVLYRLNDKHPTLRRRALHIWRKQQDDPLDEHPYRDYLR